MNAGEPDRELELAALESPAPLEPRPGTHITGHVELMRAQIGIGRREENEGWDVHRLVITDEHGELVITVQLDDAGLEHLHEQARSKPKIVRAPAGMAASLRQTPTHRRR